MVEAWNAGGTGCRKLSAKSRGSARAVTPVIAGRTAGGPSCSPRSPLATHPSRMSAEAGGRQESPMASYVNPKAYQIVSSGYTNGTQVLMGDGSVRFLKSTTDI